MPINACLLPPAAYANDVRRGFAIRRGLLQAARLATDTAFATRGAQALTRSPTEDADARAEPAQPYRRTLKWQAAERAGRDV